MRLHSLYLLLFRRNLPLQLWTRIRYYDWKIYTNWVNHNFHKRYFEHCGVNLSRLGGKVARNAHIVLFPHTSQRGKRLPQGWSEYKFSQLSAVSHSNTVPRIACSKTIDLPRVVTGVGPSNILLIDRDASKGSCQFCMGMFCSSEIFQPREEGATIHQWQVVTSRDPETKSPGAYTGTLKRWFV